MEQNISDWNCFIRKSSGGQRPRLAVENEKSKGEIYNVGESGRLDIESWVRELGSVAGWKGKVFTTDGPCPAPSLPFQLNLEQHLDMDTTRIRRDLGYQETLSRRAALERTVVWDRAHWPIEINPAQFDYVAEDAILSNRYRAPGRSA
jgi:hypothetical protein